VSLTAADVAEILRLLEQSSFDELNLEMNGMKLSLKRGATAAAAGVGVLPNAVAVIATSAASAADSSASRDASSNAAAAAAPPAASVDPNIHDVPSPLLGTFYRSPKPGALPFVEVGATVAEETIVAIIEVMKLMNTVRAGARGTVTEILPGDGTLVEYDQPILRIRKSG